MEFIRYSYKTSQSEELESGAKRLLIRLNELRNSRQPVQRLPPDVIIEIATYVNGPSTNGGDQQPLMAMSQVCRYWRQTLLLDTTSWSSISSEFIELFPLFLERSGSRLFEINLTTGTLLPYTIQHIVPHTGRLGALRCDLEESDIAALQTLSQINLSPNLRTLSIKISTPPPFAPEAIEMAFLSGEMPTLRTLELLHFPITPQFAGLKHLVEVRLEVGYSTLTNVLDLLSANPSLEKVRLLGSFEDDDPRPTGSISMKHLKFFAVERCMPCLIFDKLTFLRKARVFIRYNTIPHLIPSGYTLPRSMARYPNLQGLTSLYALITSNDTYVDLTGPNGSIAIQYANLQDGSTLSSAIHALPTTGVTQLTCESHPALIGIEIDKVVGMMDTLPYLEEIAFVHIGTTDIQNLLSALTNTRGWRNLRRLKFVHCRQIADWIGQLIGVAGGREEEGLKLNTVTIVFDVFEEGEEVEFFGVLRALVGTLKLKEEAGQGLRSAQAWDDDNCTTTTVSVPV